MWTCAVNTGQAFTAVLSVQINAGAPLTTLVAEEGNVEVAFQTPVPDWWKLGTGFCRAGNAVTVSFAGGAFSCIDYYGSVSSVVGSNSYQIGPDAAVGDPHGPIDANRVRIRTISAVDFAAAQLATPPAAGDEIFLFSIAYNKSKSTGAGSCLGCDQQACIMLKDVKLNQPAGIGDPVYTDPTGSAVLTGNTAGADCVTVPTRTKTWGQIKSLYR